MAEVKKIKKEKDSKKHKKRKSSGGDESEDEKPLVCNSTLIFSEIVESEHSLLLCFIEMITEIFLKM